MDESTKTNRIRGPEFAAKYLQGTVIDIGCGKDPVCQWAEPFDMPHGDASEIASLRTNGHYDTVHSSHCLEHMPDPVKALDQWWRLVKPGGFLVLVVPDEDLYEQGFWPSRFNPDHKATFRLDDGVGSSPVSYNIAALVKALPGVELIEAVRHDQGYDYSLMHRADQSPGRAPMFPHKLTRKMISAVAKLLGRDKRTSVLQCFDDFCFRKFGIPVDQTSRNALAQIQIIARKTVS